MPRVADIGFDKNFPQRRDGLVAVIRARLQRDPQAFTEAAAWLHETWTEFAVGKVLSQRDLDRRRRSLGSPSGPKRSRRPKIVEFQLPGDQLRADRLEQAIRWLTGKNEGKGVLRLLGGNQSKAVLIQNALRAVLVAACVIDPDAGDWLGSVTPLASAPWESSEPSGKPRIKGRVEVCRYFGQDALKLLEEAMQVLGWRAPLKTQSPLGKPPSSTTSARWPVTPEMMDLVRTKMREIVFNRDVEDAVRVDAGLTLLSCLGLQLLPGKQELPSPLEHQETLDVWRTLDEPLGRLAILAESRGIDSTPLRELVPCRTTAEAEQLRILVARLDVIAQAEAERKTIVPPKPPPTDHGDRPVRKPAGWTTGELCEEAEIALTTFGRIRKRAGVTPSPRGGGGQQRRFSNAELRRLVEAAEAGPYRDGKKIAEAWRGLLAAN